MIQDRDRVAEIMPKDAKNRISLARLEAILEAYGADSARWPLAEREAALALVRAEPKARALLGKAEALDQTLSALSRPEAPDSAFLKRLATIPHAKPMATPVRTRPGWAGTVAAALGVRSFVPQGVALAAAGMIGVWLGLNASVSISTAAVEVDTTTYFAFNPDLDKDLEGLR
jgi:hypothetical protein